MLDTADNDYRGWLWSKGVDPESIETLRDWLNAGERMFLENADELARDIFERLFKADTEDEQEAAVGELVQLGKVRTAEYTSAVRKARAKTGVARVASKSHLREGLDELADLLGDEAGRVLGDAYAAADGLPEGPVVSPDPDGPGEPSGGAGGLWRPPPPER